MASLHSIRLVRKLHYHEHCIHDLFLDISVRPGPSDSRGTTLSCKLERVVLSANYS